MLQLKYCTGGGTVNGGELFYLFFTYLLGKSEEGVERNYEGPQACVMFSKGQ